MSCHVFCGFYFLSATMTIEKCLQVCSSNGFKLAGLTSGTYCACGNTAMSITCSTTGCSQSCSGSTSQKCGGFGFFNVYSESK
jgi:hypothetical protein